MDKLIILALVLLILLINVQQSAGWRQKKKDFQRKERLDVLSSARKGAYEIYIFLIGKKSRQKVTNFLASY